MSKVTTTKKPDILHKIRHKNLRKWVVDNGRGAQAELARLLDREPNYVNKFSGANMIKTIGGTLARRIEDAIGLDPLSLDRPEASEPTKVLDLEPSNEVDHGRMVNAAIGLRRAEVLMGKILSPIEHAQMFLKLYEMSPNHKFDMTELENKEGIAPIEAIQQITLDALMLTNQVESDEPEGLTERERNNLFAKLVADGVMEFFATGRTRTPIETNSTTETLKN